MKASILQCYYRFEKTTSNNRFDCTACTRNYEIFDNNLLNKVSYNEEGISIIFNQKEVDFNCLDYYSSIALTRNRKIAELKIYEISKPLVFYGFVENTNDAIVAIFNMASSGVIVSIEIYISKGQGRFASEVCHAYFTDALSYEIKMLKESAFDFGFPEL